MSALLLLGSVVVSIVAGKCGKCGAERMIFVNVSGKTQCAGCAELAQPSHDESDDDAGLPGRDCRECVEVVP